jgi:hypothetical protein
VPRVGDALGAGVCRRRAISGKDRDLPHRLVRICRDERRKSLLGRLVRLEQLESERAVASLCIGLRRDDADARPRPEHSGAAVERARLDCGAELAGRFVAGDDRVGQGAWARILAFHSRFSAW